MYAPRHAELTCQHQFCAYAWQIVPVVCHVLPCWLRSCVDAAIDSTTCNPRQAQLPWWNQYGPDGEPAQYRTVPVPFQPSNATSPAA